MDGYVERNRFVDYTLVLDEARAVQIDLVSDEFDSLLRVYRNGEELNRDDDGGEGLNSRLSLQLEAGEYIVRASALSPQYASGSYTLGVQS